MGSAEVLVREVGLRDGLQLVARQVETQRKLAWIDAASEAGFKEMEVTSFVPPAYMPQFADAETVLAHALKSRLTPTVLAPNLEGAERALAAGARRITFIVTASEAFSRANLRRPVQRSLDELAQLAALAKGSPDRPSIIAGLSSAFGCTIEGSVPHERVRTLASSAAQAGVDEITLADTVGYAEPVAVRRLIASIRADLPHVPLGVHFHDTRGTALANVLAALDAGVCIFESGWAGLGGCPHSPGATGNVATEDLVYMLEAMGIATGIDLERLLALVDDVVGHLPDAAHHSHLRGAGLPVGFRGAKERLGL